MQPGWKTGVPLVFTGLGGGKSNDSQGCIKNTRSLWRIFSFTGHKYHIQLLVSVECPPSDVRSLPMIYKGVEFTVTPAGPGIWAWQFRIGDKIKTGKTEAKLNLLAIRRVQLRIDRELKKAAQERLRDSGN